MNAFSAGKRHVTVYDAVNVIYDIITTADPSPYILLNSCLTVLENSKTPQIRR